MSISTVAQVRSSSKSTGSARTLLLVIASHVNPDTGLAWPSLDTLAYETGLQRRRTIDLIHLLEDLGELEIRRGRGRGRVNFYRVHVVPDEKVQSQPMEKVQSSVRKGAISHQEKVQYVAPKSKSKRKKKEAPTISSSPSFQDNVDALEQSHISPEVARKFGLRYGVDNWPPRRRER